MDGWMDALQIEAAQRLPRHANQVLTAIWGKHRVARLGFFVRWSLGLCLAALVLGWLALGQSFLFHPSFGWCVGWLASLMLMDCAIQWVMDTQLFLFVCLAQRLPRNAKQVSTAFGEAQSYVCWFSRFVAWLVGHGQGWLIGLLDVGTVLDGYATFLLFS